jgi:hypothetical protein
MSRCVNLWAVGFADTGRAAQVQDVITSLGQEKHQLVHRDVAVAVRYCDGCFTLNAEPFTAVTRTHSDTIAHFLAACRWARCP